MALHCKSSNICFSDETCCNIRSAGNCYGCTDTNFPPSATVFISDWDILPGTSHHLAFHIFTHSTVSSLCVFLNASPLKCHPHSMKKKEKEVWDWFGSLFHFHNAPLGRCVLFSHIRSVERKKKQLVWMLPFSLWLLLQLSFVYCNHPPLHIHSQLRSESSHTSRGSGTDKRC